MIIKNILQRDNMKTLAIDYGKKKVGLAISDELGMVTAKLPVLRVNREDDKIEGIIMVIKDNMPDEVLFGVPTNWEGKDTEQTKEVKEFAEKVESIVKAQKLNVVFKFWDETFSSQRAEKGKSKKFKHNKSDSEAARLFLQDYLDSK